MRDDRAIAVRSFRAVGTSALLAVTDSGAAGLAEALVRSELDALDRACSRFRADSELSLLYGSPGTPVEVSQLLFEVVATACEVALMTGGAVDPTVGRSLEALGYDRDYADLQDGAEVTALSSPGPQPAPGWWTIAMDAHRRTIAVAAGVRIDVGSSAKAFAADRAARLVAERTGAGTLVSVGGDVAVFGPVPAGGWRVGIALSSSADPSDADQVIAVTGGGVASSSPGVRAWRHGGVQHHHIVDPVTGCSASTCWALVSAAGPTCVEANAATTAAIVWGEDAIPRLEGLGLPVRLVGADGEVLVLNGWPGEDAPTLAGPAPR